MVNRYISLVLIAIWMLGTVAVYGQVTPPSGIVGWYAGDGDAHELSGNSNNGTLGTGASYRVGKIGQ